MKNNSLQNIRDGLETAYIDKTFSSNLDFQGIHEEFRG